MGQGNSSPELLASGKQRGFDAYSTLSGQRFLADRNTTIQPRMTNSSSFPRSLLTVSFHGDWSMLYPESVCPSPRRGQCAFYSQEKDSLVIAYGENSKGEYFNDCWVLDFGAMKWQKIETDLLSPRSGCSCVNIGDVLYFFGGQYQNSYFADLHALNLATGECYPVETTGHHPEGRKNCVMGFWDGRIFIWGGFNGKSPTDIYFLTMETMEWKKIETPFLGRASPAYHVSGSDIWIYGSTRNQGLIKLDMSTLTIIPIESTGPSPPMSNQSAFMIQFDNYLLIFGGKGDQEMTHVYAYDIERSFWFLFHVRPDGDTLTAADGSVADGGLFMLPSEYGYSACYRQNTKQIIAVLGSNGKDPPPIYVIYVGDAICFLNHRTDMLVMLQCQ